MSLQNVETVQNIYAAFGRGDAAAILARVTDDTRWGFAGGRPEVVAYHHPVAGRDTLPGFFQQLSETVDITRFEPGEFVQSGPHVVCQVRIAFNNRRTGKPVDQTQVHWWTFDAAGRVAAMTHYEDTAQVLAAAT